MCEDKGLHKTVKTAKSMGHCIVNPCTGCSKSLCAPDDYNTETLQVMFKVSPASLQTFIDMPNCVLEDRVQCSTVYILNVIMVSD
jgi:hypothetical protein